MMFLLVEHQGSVEYLEQGAYDLQAPHDEGATWKSLDITEIRKIVVPSLEASTARTGGQHVVRALLGGSMPCTHNKVGKRWHSQQQRDSERRNSQESVDPLVGFNERVRSVRLRDCHVRANG